MNITWETLYATEADEASSMTALRGEVTTTRRAIEAVFGKPNFEGKSGDGKVTTEWVIRIGDTVATIYDYKRYEDGAPTMDEYYDWHIGGKMDYTGNVASTIVELLYGESIQEALNG